MAAQKLFKLIGCEIFVRELYHVSAQSPHLVDSEFLTQGYHDTPGLGKNEIQRRIDAVPAAKYDAILLGYALCSSILSGLTTRHTPLVVPRAHDCITLFLGSRERYQRLFGDRPGTYYFTSGWLEYARRRGEKGWSWGGGPSVPANASLNFKSAYEKWAQKYGEERAQYLLDEMSRWTDHYTHGVLITFEFLKPLGLERQVQQICADKNWQYEEIPGDLSLLRNLVEGEWPQEKFLVITPGQKLVPAFDDQVVKAVAES